MDVLYIGAATLMWIAIVGLVRGCDQLRVLK
jgi:hypothetical protein